MQRMVTPNYWRSSNTRGYPLQEVWLFPAALVFAHYRNATHIISVNDLYDTTYFIKDDANMDKYPPSSDNILLFVNC